MITAPPALALDAGGFRFWPLGLWHFLVLPLATIAVIPFGLKLCTGRWESLLTVMMIAAALLSIIGGYAVGVLLEPLELPRDLLPVVQMSVEEGLIAALAGIWLFANYRPARDDRDVDEPDATH